MIRINVRVIGGKYLNDEDFEHFTICDGIVVLKKNAIIPNGTTIGCYRVIDFL